RHVPIELLEGERVAGMDPPLSLRGTEGRDAGRIGRIRQLLPAGAIQMSLHDVTEVAEGLFGPGFACHTDGIHAEDGGFLQLRESLEGSVHLSLDPCFLRL